MISLFGIDFHLYGLILGIAILGALQVSIKYAERQEIKKELIEKMAWWVVIGGLLGARVYHVVHLWNDVYSLNPVSALYVWNGGLGIWGGVIGGVLGLVGYHLLTEFCFANSTPGVRRRRDTTPGEKFFRLMDVAAIGVPLGQAIGRLGNWVNGELYGKNGEPLFAWEAGLNLVLFMVLWRIGTANLTSKNLSGSTSEQIARKQSVSDEKPSGRVTGVYLVGYGLIRMILENFRPEDVIWKWQGVPVAVIVGIVSLLAGGVILVKKRS